MNPLLGLKLAGAGLAGSVLLLAGTAAFYNVKLHNRAETIRAAEKTIGKVTGERNACLKSLGTLNLAVDQQNAAVADYRADSERRLAEAQKAVRDAQAAAAGARRTAARILASRPAAPSCATAEAVLRGEEG